MKLVRPGWYAILSLSLAGCASTPAVRSLARQNGAFVQSLSTGTEDFLAFQNRLNAQGEARLQALDADAAATGADTRQLRLAWSDAGETTRYQTLDRATAVSADSIIATMFARPTAPTIIDPVAGGYGASIKALATMSEKPKALDQLGELFTYAQTVRKTFTDLQDKATAAAATAASSAASSDASAQKATGDTVIK